MIIGDVTAVAAGVATVSAGGSSITARCVGTTPTVGQTAYCLDAPPFGTFCLGAILG